MINRISRIVFTVAVSLAASHIPAGAAPASAGGKQVKQSAAQVGAPRSLDWLGPLPAEPTREAMMAMHEKLLERVMEDVSGGRVGPNGPTQAFKCMKPAELGPVPLMADLQAYLDAFPKGRHDPALVDGLYRSAAAGNWLARSWLLDYLADRLGARKLAADEELVTSYRFVQLASWLQENRYGSVHASIGALYWPRQPGVGLISLPTNDFYAATHGAYVSQLRVGSYMLENGSGSGSGSGSETKAKEMIDCALSVSPAYAFLATGSFGADADMTR